MEKDELKMLLINGFNQDKREVKEMSDYELQELYLDKLNDNELMELLETDNPAYKDIVDTSYIRPYEEFDNLVDGDY